MKELSPLLNSGCGSEFDMQICDSLHSCLNRTSIGIKCTALDVGYDVTQQSLKHEAGMAEIRERNNSELIWPTSMQCRGS
jgi:hypothetical protein